MARRHAADRRRLADFVGAAGVPGMKMILGTLFVLSAMPLAAVAGTGLGYLIEMTGIIP